MRILGARTQSVLSNADADHIKQLLNKKGTQISHLIILV